jgi:hypothetical protein
MTILAIAFFAGTLYVSLDVGLTFTEALGPDKVDPLKLRGIPLFVLLNIWPAV